MIFLRKKIKKERYSCIKTRTALVHYPRFFSFDLEMKSNDDDPDLKATYLKATYLKNEINRYKISKAKNLGSNSHKICARIIVCVCVYKIIYVKYRIYSTPIKFSILFSLYKLRLCFNKRLKNLQCPIVAWNWPKQQLGRRKKLIKWIKNQEISEN